MPEHAVPPAPRRDRSAAARAAALARKAGRDERIAEAFGGGASAAEIAGREGLSASRMRGLLREVLARRQPQAPDAFAAREVARLHMALSQSFDAMRDDRDRANFAAIDVLVRSVRALDAFGGFVPPQGPTPGLARAKTRPENRPQASEKAQNRTGNGAVPKMGRGRSKHRPRPEEPAKRASRRTFAGPWNHPSRRVASGAAPQDEVGV